MKSFTLSHILALSCSVAATIVNLGTAITYGVVSGTAGVANTGLTVITGNLGTTAASITGFGPGVVTGTKNINNPAGITAFNDASLAYAQAFGLVGGINWSSMSDLTGRTILPGIYKFSGTVSLNGQVFLNAQGNSSATWVFQIGSALNINLGSQVILTNGAKACNIFWQAGSTAVIQVNTAFQGNVLAYAGINVKTSASVKGGLYAKTASVTLEGNAVKAPNLVC
ncbi:hypothetical protein B0T24DRAFT_641419 [Lasiosphaeria ovina]|uniref:Antifreeze protein n=1 Tax=Lasiosphaeria ovina TaxID=92902 RepID=A0AAE0JTN5_9PEZI|nr:hypothetical protein B0T24DRAFT_641419 [Lasiosphaeria ovina]